MGVIGGAINVGERQRRITFDVPGQAVPDGDGGYTQGYAPLDPPALFGKVQPATLRDIENLAAGTVLSQATHLITVPFHKGITTQARAQWTDDALRPHTANVTGVVNVDERCRTLILGATEVVV